jgi:hypothetical protein
MRKSQVIATTLLLWAAAAAHADTLVSIVENTSSINGTSGSLDFQFNPGPLVTQGATVKILGFTGGSLLGAASTTSSVSGGPLPATVTIANTGAFNDYFQDFHYGNAISFTLDFGGPAVTTPNGLSTSTSLFTFSTFSDAAGIVPVLTADPNGTAATVTVNLNGTLTAAAVSPDVQILPEPGSLWLLSGALAIFGGRRLARRNDSMRFRP